MAEWEAKKKEILATKPDATVGKGIPYPPPAVRPPSAIIGSAYNGLIMPLRRVAISGVIWYQGESDVGDAAGYTKQFPAVIRHWRQTIGGGGGDFPFLYVQIADGASTPVLDPNRPNSMSELRNAQLAALALPNTAMVVTLDVCQPNDAHPIYKRPVGERLARAAFALKYGQNIPNYSSPVLDSLKVDGDKLVLKFKLADGGLISKNEDKKVTGFTLAGPDGKFFFADATIDNDTITVSSPSVKAPTVVRYAWGLMPQYCVFNKADLPLGTFQAAATAKPE